MFGFREFPMETGIVNKNFKLSSTGFQDLRKIHYNLGEPALVQESIRRGEGRLGLGGALLVTTGTHTGRSPNDKYIVCDDITDSRIWWAENGKMSPKNFEKLHLDMISHMKGKEYYVQDLYASADPLHRVNVRLINELAWHALFIRHLLRRPHENEIKEFKPEFTLLNCPTFKANPKKYGCRSNTVIAINFSKKMVLVGGTEYAGENKKAIFSLLNYILPIKNVMPMHCSANHARGNDQDVALFFGLSGTGKTTLSQDPKRVLIGDDEHGWSDTRIFNIEGGCYAKTINLSAKAEPEIFSTTSKFGTVIENMVFDKVTLKLDYKDDTLTPNMRAAYPLNYITNSSRNGCGGLPKNIIFLTCDAFGVLPPISKLSPEQAIYHFLSGFTSKIPGTERGIVEPKPTFSACYSAPFLPLKPEVYGKLLKEKIDSGDVRCWLVNTGWSGGLYGVGKRMPIKATRALLTAALTGSLNNSEFRTDQNFGFKVPFLVTGVDTKLLNPRDTWKDHNAYDLQAKKLVKMFSDNFKQYESSVGEEILKASI
jgi:phosphoenolpyruvate carboxykinase (ATP)